MAPKKKEKKEKSSKPQGSDKNQKKQGGFLYGLLTVLMSLLIVAAVFAGAFYYVVHNNIEGIGETFRPYIQKTPIIRYALPPLPEEEDPNDPKYLTQNELIKKYNELRTQNLDLQTKLNEAQYRVNMFDKDRLTVEQMYDDAIKKIEDYKQQEQNLKELQEQIDSDIEALGKSAANQDTTGFKQYYEKLDPVTAEKIYKEIIEKEAMDNEIKSLIKKYEGMEAKQSAKVLEQLGESDMDLVIEIVQNMKSSIASEIIQSMNAQFASELTRQIADKIKSGN